MVINAEDQSASRQHVLACGHEYSAANARYVESLGWARDGIDGRIAEINAMRADDEPTLPTLMQDERLANPFLNCDAADLAAAFGLDAGDPVAVFTALRQGKDNFKGQPTVPAAGCQLISERR